MQERRRYRAGMDTEPAVEQQLLAHAERQTELLRSINGAVWWLLGLVALGAVLGVLVFVVN